MADGLDALRGRRRRMPPPSRHPIDTSNVAVAPEPDASSQPAPDAPAVTAPEPPAPAAVVVAGAPPAETATTASPPPAAKSAERRSVPRRTAPETHRSVLETMPDEPQANLAIRVRRSLDFRLSDLVHEFRRENVKTSKVEIVEMLLSELPAHVTADLRARLQTLRERAPRSEA